MTGGDRVGAESGGADLLQVLAQLLLAHPLSWTFFMRMITTGHFTQRVFLRQHFFFGFRPATVLALNFFLPIVVLLPSVRLEVRLAFPHLNTKGHIGLSSSREVGLSRVSNITPRYAELGR